MPIQCLEKKGVTAHLTAKNSPILIRGCPCLLIYIAAKKAVSVFDINVHMFFIDIFFFLDRSSKHKTKFKKQQELCGQKPHKILKSSSSRWLLLTT